MNTKTAIAVAALSACLFSVGAQRASGQTLLIDRGLPTANLNDAAGSNRSNVSWAFPGYPGWLIGDDFTNQSALTYDINDIRVWTVGDNPPSDLSLYGGLSGSDLSIISTSAAVTEVTYQGGYGYQGSSGYYPVPLYQVDFSVNVALGAGGIYDFAVDGTTSDAPANDPYISLSASNAALSGSPQVGSDNLFLEVYASGGTILAGDIYVDDSNGYDAGGYGWDKGSDINVQVFGATPDAASTLGLLGLALSGLAILRRKLHAG